MSANKSEKSIGLAIEAVRAAKEACLAKRHTGSAFATAATILFDDLADAIGNGELRGRSRSLRELSEFTGYPGSAPMLARRLRDYVAYRLATDTHGTQVLIKGPTAFDRGDNRRSELYLSVEFVDLPLRPQPAQEPQRRIRVFICHASDDKPTVRELSRDLTSAGFDVWIDEDKLLPGQEWQLEIQRAIRESDAVLACLSQRSVTKSGFVQRELRLALNMADERPEGRIFLIPVKIEPCEVPDRLQKWQWVALYEQGAKERLLRALKICSASQ